MGTNTAKHANLSIFGFQYFMMRNSVFCIQSILIRAIDRTSRKKKKRLSKISGTLLVYIIWPGVCVSSWWRDQGACGCGETGCRRGQAVCSHSRQEHEVTEMRQHACALRISKRKKASWWSSFFRTLYKEISLKKKKKNHETWIYTILT